MDAKGMLSGEHTRDVLQRLGYGARDIDRLVADGIVKVWPDTPGD